MGKRGQRKSKDGGVRRVSRKSEHIIVPERPDRANHKETQVEEDKSWKDRIESSPKGTRKATGCATVGRFDEEDVCLIDTRWA